MILGIHEHLLAQLKQTLEEKLGDQIGDFLLPPPVFVSMKGELLELDILHGRLTARFPILQSYLNPYGAVQGGIIAAAVDNTIGPLSVAVAPPNVTRTLEMKFSRPAVPEMEYIVVQARLVQRNGRHLVFEARASSPDGQKLATCTAVHYVINSSTDAD